MNGIPVAKAKLEKACLDSSVFISWIDATPDRMDAIEFLNDRIECREVGIVASVLVLTEVLPGKRSVDAFQKFTDFLKRKNQVEVVAVDLIIAEAARKIRDNIRIKTPDAIHLATAIVHRIPTFYTYDRKLLNLSGTPEVKNLIICEPPASQQSKLF